MTDNAQLDSVMREILSSPGSRVGMTEMTRIFSRDGSKPCHRASVTKLIREGVSVRGQADPVRLKAVVIGERWVSTHRFIEDFIRETTSMSLENLHAPKRRGRHAHASAIA